MNRRRVKTEKLIHIEMRMAKAMEIFAENMLQFSTTFNSKMRSNYCSTVT